MRDIELEVTDIKNIIILIIYDKIHQRVFTEFISRIS